MKFMSITDLLSNPRRIELLVVALSEPLALAELNVSGNRNVSELASHNVLNLLSLLGYKTHPTWPT